LLSNQNIDGHINGMARVRRRVCGTWIGMWEGEDGLARKQMTRIHVSGGGVEGGIKY